MKKSYLKPESYVWFYFTIYDLFTMNMMGMGEKNPNIYKWKNKEKNSPFGCPPIPPSVKLAADCFPGERTENKPDLP